ncbi:PA14 domain-containing protein [Verrucomicrobia bacterium]|nr:PA14 domain-containing protein [Verrucomicrobiota bacterium]
MNYIPATGSTYTGDAEIYHAGTKAPESGGVGTNNGGGLLVREFQGIGGASLGDLLTNAKWPNSPDLVTWSNHAEWPQNSSGDINDVPEGNVQDNYATQLLGFVHPPETGEYQFFLAADDSTALFLSTDETPDNKRLIAIEPNWNGVREFGQGRNRVVVDNDTGRKINGSAPISLEAGKAYFIEAITKEGGGGDNLAITWIRAGDDLPADGALPISGDHLSPWLVQPPPPSAVDNGDGTVTFETHLAWEWWDGIGGAHPMENLTDNPRYPGSPDGATFAPSWNTRTALAGGFEGDGRENYGGRMSGVLTAPETGTYRFFIASDDHGLLRISTDADPANAVRVAEQTGCCNNFTLDDGGLSGTVDLVAGNQYYMESLLKEGGGGDWMTVAWRMPSEDIDSVPGGNQDGISGEYFTGTVTVNENLPALSSSLSPGDGAVGMVPNPTFTLNVSNGATTLDADSVSISLDGNKLEHTATEGSWSRSYSVVSQEFKTYSITASSANLAGSSEHTVSATFTDSAGTETTHEASFTVTDNLVLLAEAGTVKYIEAEDFNYDGGSWMTFEEVGTGGAYDGLGAEMGVDLNNAGNNSPKYRVIDPHPGMTESMWDSGRNGFDMDVDFKMGWNGGGEWWNYTRDFAEEDTYYHVYGRFSSGGGAIDNKLSIVTSDATTADQTLEDVGVFQGPATGGWNTMKFFPMTDSTGNLGVVKIGGVTTVRLSMMGGAMDANYLAFVKAAVQSYPPLLVSTSPSGAADSSAVIQAVLKKRDIDLADASITVNGAAADVDVATDGDTITLTVSGSPSKLGNNDVSLSYNGETTEWSYFYYGDQYTEDGLNLLASWDFNEGTVDSVSGIEGVLVGGATLTDGSLDVRAAGNSAMLVEDAVFMNIASAMNKLTVAFWQNSASIPSTSSFWAYSPSTGSGGRAAQGHVPWSNGHIYWDTAGCCGGDTRIEKLWEGDWSTWNHFAFVKNGDAKEIWVNGELHHSGSNNGVLPGDISRLAVGAMIDSATSQGGNSANSQIDDFKVFAQGLTQDQIKTLMGLPVDISAPGNAVVPSSTEHPAGEHAGLAIDNDSSTKYLNFDKLDTGLTITTGGGVVTGLGLTSANDAPERDPASFVLSGSNDGGATFTEIATGDIAAFGERFERQEVSFDNSTAYTTYQLVFPTVANADAANSMQIAEIELLGTAAEAQPEPEAPALSIVNNGDGTITVTFEGKLEAAASVNGPWQDSGLTSPATINSDQAQQYGRAVRE